MAITASTRVAGVAATTRTLAGSAATLVRHGAMSWQLAAGTDCSHGGGTCCLPPDEWLSAGISGIAVRVIAFPAPAAEPAIGIAHLAPPPASESWRVRTMVSTVAMSG